ncbi:unnamed protein product [Plutella xylostella]|uniref:(diamondback moth) hypothetical protein n=1 Tax=Plutella xylostella TaxID=51655 RepID=A0A8S4FZW9_PLUXY|nr:unnamed protein product [Plutella xylostella]
MLCRDCNQTSGDGATCTSCKKDLCFSCANLTERGYRNLGTERRAAWKCPKCRISSPKVQSSALHKKESSIEDVLGVLDTMAKKLDVLPQLMSDVNDMKTKMDDVVKSCEFACHKVDEFEAKLSGVCDQLASLEAAKATITALQSAVDSLQHEHNEKDQWSRLNNVEIKGVPMKNNENLFKIVESLSGHVGFPIEKSQINFVTRVPVYNSKEKSILIGFVNRYAKEDFVAAGRAKKDLKACDIGYSNCEHRVYFNDHLSPGNKRLLSRVKEFAREKNFRYVWVKHAKIHVRKNDGSPAIVVKSVEGLNKLQ